MKILGYEFKKIEKLPLPIRGEARILPIKETINNPGTITWQGQNQESQVKTGYMGNDIVYSIIRLITDKVKIAPWAEYVVTDETEYKRYTAIMKRPDLIKDWDKVKDLRHKALKLTPTKGKITDLLNAPNSQDSWADIVEVYASFKLITGNAYVYGNIIQDGKNTGLPQEIHVLPSQYMSISADLNVFPIVPVGYQMYMQFVENFTVQEVLHDKYFNPNWSVVGNQLYGLSPLQAAAKVLTRSNEGKQAAVSNYQNGGPKGILFVSDDRFDPAYTVQEANDIRKSLVRNQGATNVNQVETSGYKVDYVPLGLSPVDLDLLNAENMDLRALCNIYGVPSQLLNDPDNKTYSNTIEGEKALTVRCALPMLESIRDQFNRKFMKDWGNQKTIIDFDPMVYQELQDDIAVKVGWLKDAPLTLRRKLEILNESPEGYSEEQLNSIIISSGMTTLDEVIQPVLPPDLNDYAK